MWYARIVHTFVPLASIRAVLRNRNPRVSKVSL
jgi:hypothetical protein